MLKIKIVCDHGCTESHEFVVDKIDVSCERQATIESKKKGWKIFLSKDGEFVHQCPTCAEFNKFSEPMHTEQ